MPVASDGIPDSTFKTGNYFLVLSRPEKTVFKKFLLERYDYDKRKKRFLRVVEKLDNSTDGIELEKEEFALIQKAVKPGVPRTSTVLRNLRSVASAIWMPKAY